ncbi:MAG TPA: phospholipase C, phosphocholine-specific [Chitinophagaceae bacterium]|nr:phospholipase C, phosphocholine-specific [Chitinophagaceae bacterium]
MDSRRDFLKKASVLASGAGLLHVLPASLAKALAIDPAPGSTYMDAEHIVLLMQENRSFDHTYGTLKGVRGFNDPRAIRIPGNNLVWLQPNKKGETYAPFRFDIKGTKITWMDSLPHSWANQVDARNNGKYNGWLDNKHSGNDDYKAMPLTMGYYTRADIPFYYSLADAFTVCDQNFCSSLTGTTPNRLFFWTGTIREKPDESVQANVWNEDADYLTMVNWKTFPERLEENGIAWKIYQNELSVGVGFEGEEDSWLANFGDNPIEYFKQYNVKLHPEYIKALPTMAKRLNEELEKREKKLKTLGAGSKEAKQVDEEIKWIKKYIDINTEDQKNCTPDKFEKLSQFEKNIHQKAFVTNRNDPSYHELMSLKYKDGHREREVKVPKGDVLHQFRQDVENGQLPTVSWLVAPENFSDHPASAWYGAWYISEVVDILTKNPEVWKKTIFILTYDENDGYFDHVPPFIAPHPTKKETGFTSSNIHTGVDYVANEDQQSIKDHARESSIGLGYRVPMVIASPWSRGGWVNSEVFDHTSCIQFLEKFLSQKFGKKIEEPNISEWRRTICGDLTSVFRPNNDEKLNKPEFLARDEFVESIHKAQFKNPPTNYKRLTKKEIEQINKQPHSSPFMAAQEKGTRSSCALPYELYADGILSDDKNTFEISIKAGNDFFGASSAGSPFQVYTPGKYKNEQMGSRAYAVAAGDELKDNWDVDAFENGHYHFRIYGPNGFFREFSGDKNHPLIDVKATYEQADRKPTGNIILQIANRTKQSQGIVITDNSYKAGSQAETIGAASTKEITLDTSKSFGWHDVTIKLKDKPSFTRRFAGRVETGAPGKSDPLMGRAI